MKKVALIGNPANNFFSIARYLRDRGFDARLFLMEQEEREWPHFHPSADSFTEEYKEYTETSFFSKHPTPFFHTSKASIRAFFQLFDFVIGCSTLPAYAAKAGIQLDMFIPYGSDLYWTPFYTWRRANWKKLVKRNVLAYYQRQGIRKSRYFLFDNTNSDNESVLNKVNPKGRWIKGNAPFIYIDEYDFISKGLPAYPSKHFQELSKIKKLHDFVVFHHCRHEWKSVPKENLAYKANNHLIEGFAKFVRKHRCKPLLVLCEYGTDVSHSKKLIQDLGITEFVYWLPVLPRKELMLCLTLADIGVGELGRSWFSYSVIFEFMTMGVPVVHNRDERLYKDKVLYPMFCVKSASDVCNVLRHFVESPEHFKDVGLAGKRWFKTFAIDQPLKKIVKAISEA